MTFQDYGLPGQRENPLTFQQAAESYLACEKLNSTPGTFASKVRLVGIAAPILGEKALTSITPEDIEGILTAVAQSGKTETVKRLRLVISQVFRFASLAVPGGFQDPTLEAKESFPSPSPAPSPAITDQAIFGRFLQAIDAYKGSPSTRLCLKLSVLLVLRPGEMRDLKWDQIDLVQKTITLHAPKGRWTHVVPLSRQAVEALEEAKGISDGTGYVFPGRTGRQNLSPAAIIAAIRKLGFSEQEVSPFGFRLSFTCFMREKRWDGELIEAELRGTQPRTVGKFGSQFVFKQREKLMQAWADLCDEMKASAQV